MKRLTILILLSVLFPLSLLSQSYTIEGYPTIEPWISESYLEYSPKFWYSHLKMEGEETFINLCYNIMGDSLLNDKVYAKVGVGYDKKEDLLENLPIIMIALHPYKKGEYSDILLFRQEGDKVFYWDKINQKDLLILNYGLNEGDTFINAVGDEYIVSEVSSIYKSQYGIQNWYTTAQKKLRLVAKDSGEEDVWVEGIGSLNWGILPLFLASQVAPLSSETLLPQKSQVALSSGSNYMGQFFINEPYYKFLPFEIDNYGNETETENYKDLTYWFEGDTLCIKGYMNLNCYNTYAECLIKDQVIDIMIKQAYLLDELDCLHETFVNVRIPGFEAGIYNVGVVGENRVTVVCEGADGIQSIDNEPLTFDHEIYDLSGRRVSPSSALKGVYIKQGKKVVNK